MIERLHFNTHLAQYHDGYFNRYIDAPDPEELRELIHEQRDKINEIIDYLNKSKDMNGKI